MFDLRDQSEDLRRQLNRVARRTGHPSEAVFLVLYAMLIAGRGLPDVWWTPTDRGPIPDVPVRHLTAVEVCDAICRCARARVGAAEARRYFHFWGMKTGAEVGRIVYALIEEGVGYTAPDDRPEQFDRVPLLRLLNPVRDAAED